MTEQGAAYYLFPHTVAPEASCRQLSLIVPDLRVLQVLGPATPQTCYSELLSPVVAFSDEGERERVRALLSEYQKIGAVHEDAALLNTVVRDMVTHDFSESRFGIQARMRGKFEIAPEDAIIMRREAALFLELAEDLDRKELEMDRNLSQVGTLEQEFKEILGVTDTEDLNEVVESKAPPLNPEWGHFTYQLRKRMGFWWRLFSGCAPVAEPVWVVLLRDVVEELVEAARTAEGPDGNGWSVIEARLGRMPSLGSLSTDQLNELMWRLHEAGVQPLYHEALRALVAAPMDGACREAMERAALSLEEVVESAYDSAGWPQDPAVAAVLTRLPGADWKRIWRRFDRAGCEGLGGVLPASETLTVIHLEPA